jgi:hypothetical protein
MKQIGRATNCLWGYKMKNKIDEKWGLEGMSRVHRESSGQMYFTSQRRLLELKRNLRKKTQDQNKTYSSFASLALDNW